MGADSKKLLHTFFDEVRGYLVEVKDFISNPEEQPACKAGMIPIYADIHNLKGVSGLMELESLHKLSDQVLRHLDTLQKNSSLTIGDLKELLGDFVRSVSAMLSNIELNCEQDNASILADFKDSYPVKEYPRERNGDSFNEELMGLFLTEAFQAMEGIEKALDILENTPADGASRANLFRHCMNLRGSASIVEQEQLELLLILGAELTEKADNSPPEDSSLWHDFRFVAMVIKELLGNLEQRVPIEAAYVREVMDQLQTIYPKEVEQAMRRSSLSDERPHENFDSDFDFDDEDDEELERELQDIFKMEGQEHLGELAKQVVELEKNPGDLEVIDQLFRTVHTLKGAAATAGYSILADMSHRLEDVLEIFREKRQAAAPELIDLLYSSEPMLRKALELPLTDPQQLQPVLDQYSKLVSQHFDELGIEISIEDKQEKSVSDKEIEDNVEELPEELETSEDKKPSQAITLRVSMDKLDRLMDVVSQLEIGRERINEFTREISPLSKQLKRERRKLNQTISAFQKKYQWDNLFSKSDVSPLEEFSELEFDRYEDLHVFTRNLEDLDFKIASVVKEFESKVLQFREDAGEIGKSIGVLREEFITMRMIPVDSIFRFLSFQTRDLARKFDKKVQVKVYGEHALIDKGIADTLSECLMHMVRNSLTHGIEAPRDRKELGKDEEGSIWLRAYQTGRHVQVELEDDGAGINRIGLKRSAVRSGLISPQEAESQSDSQLLDLVFSPHITTREVVDDTSGRGVGLDAVRHQIASLYGSVKVESEEGRGTKFSITLPLTLALQEVLTVSEGGQNFQIPMNYVEALVEPGHLKECRSDSENDVLVEWEGESIPCRYLGRYLGRPLDKAADEFPAVILYHVDHRMALKTERIISREEQVVRPLPPILHSCEHIIGTTISAKGEVRPVLSVVEFFQRERFVGAYDVERLKLPEQVKVLVADDSLSVRQTLKRMIAKHGMKANTAKDGLIAWQKLHTIKPDVIIVDLEMPGLNGYELIKRIHNSEHFREMGIIILTSRGGDKHRRLAFEIGADGYLTKPVPEQRLIGWIRKVLPEHLRELMDEKDWTIE